MFGLAIVTHPIGWVHAPQQKQGGHPHKKKKKKGRGLLDRQAHTHICLVLILHHHLCDVF